MEKTALIFPEIDEHLHERILWHMCNNRSINFDKLLSHSRIAFCNAVLSYYLYYENQIIEHDTDDFDFIDRVASASGTDMESTTIEANEITVKEFTNILERFPEDCIVSLGDSNEFYINAVDVNWTIELSKEPYYDIENEEEEDFSFTHSNNYIGMKIADLTGIMYQDLAFAVDAEQYVFWYQRKHYDALKERLDEISAMIEELEEFGVTCSLEEVSEDNPACCTLTVKP